MIASSSRFLVTTRNVSSPIQAAGFTFVAASSGRVDLATVFVLHFVDSG